MSTVHKGNIQPQLDLEEHQGDTNSKRISVIAPDGSRVSATTRWNGDTSDGISEPLAGVVIRKRASGGSVETFTDTSPGVVTDKPLPFGATQVVGYSGNRAALQAAATLSGTNGKTTYITGFQITASGSTAALVVNATVTDGTWTFTYTFTFPAGVAVAATPLIVQFPKPVAASATNTAITVTLPAGGAGNTNASVNAQGFQL